MKLSSNSTSILSSSRPGVYKLEPGRKPAAPATAHKNCICSLCALRAAR